jgi:hypothetical protein
VGVLWRRRGVCRGGYVCFIGGLGVRGFFFFGTEGSQEGWKGVRVEVVWDWGMENGVGWIS